MTKVIHKKLGRHKAWGLVDEKRPNSKILIDPRQRPKAYMGTLIHERLHLLFPDFSETKILRLEREIAKLLWENNYRQVKQ